MVDRVLLSYGLHLDLSCFIFIQKTCGKDTQFFWLIKFPPILPVLLSSQYFLNSALSAMPGSVCSLPCLDDILVLTSSQVVLGFAFTH